MEDRDSHEWWHPGRGIIQKPLMSGRPSLMLGYARVRSIGNTGGETVTSSDAECERTHSDQDERRTPALARIFQIGDS